jgi:hypothetical protein
MANTGTLKQALVLLLLSATANVSVAQRPMPIPRDEISSAGTIKGIQNGVLHVVNIGGDQWLLKVEADAAGIVLKGKATPDWLRPGMPVTFRGSFFKNNKTGQPQGEARKPITQLRVFSVKKDSKAGLKEESKRGSFLSSGPKKDEPMKTAPFTVTGVLTKYKNGKMTVAMGNIQLKADLAKDAKVAVEINDLRFARAGDEIEFKGWHYLGQKEKVHATDVSVTISKPLGSDETKKQLASKNRTANAVGTDEQRETAHKIQVAIKRARTSCEAGDHRKAVLAVESIIVDWDAFLNSDEVTAARLLVPYHQPLKQIHASLEMEGFMLPVLPNMPTVVGAEEG